MLTPPSGRSAYRFQHDIHPHQGIMAGVVEHYAMSQQEADALALATIRRFAATHARGEQQPFTWVVRAHGRIVGTGTEGPSAPIGAGSGATRCPTCGQTVSYVNGRINSHQRIEDGVRMNCPGSGSGVS